jgi:superfamily II DNA or RNA helicase
MPSEDIDIAIAAAKAELADVEGRRSTIVERLAMLNEQKAAGTVEGDEDRANAWPAAKKVELFRSLFRGRDDVFAVRWENEAKQRAGYAPRCANEWRRGICDKPRVRCGACPNQEFLPADGGAILAHLQGRHVVGVYPLLTNETTRLLAIDFDGERWPEDVAALRHVAREAALEPAVERSRSGAGAHAWFFFDSPVAASRARALGELLLTRAMSRSSSLRMESYDRLFPSQDTMPAGGFGNLIALPLQRDAREHDNTVFLDDDLIPFADQWGFLASVQRITSAGLDALLADIDDREAWLATSDEHDGDRPWRPARSLSDRLRDVELPKAVSATLAQRLYVERRGLPPALVDALRRLATFANPEFLERQAMRLSTALTPRVIACFEEHDQHLALPRGCLANAQALLADLGVELTLKDERTDGSAIDASFTGTLSDAQRDAVADLLAHDIGVLCAPPAAGKTVMGASLIAQRGRSTLILVHRKPLVEQWIARLREFLDVAPDAIGTLGGAGSKPSGVIDVATVQALSRTGTDASVLERYGHVVVDECHHVPAVSIERLLGSCPARHFIGLTATPYRRDGHHPIIAMQCGPVRHTMTPARHGMLGLRVIKRETGFDPSGLPPDPAIQEVYSALAMDTARTDLVASDALALLAEGRAPVVLTERRNHLDRLVERLAPHVEQLVALHGDVTVRRRRDALARLTALPPDQPRLVLATGRFLGEGFDDPRLDTLLLAMPIAWKGTVVQYAGRLHRAHNGKSDVRIYDYVDGNVPVLRRMFAKRAKAYRAMDYVIDESPPARAG